MSPVRVKRVTTPRRAHISVHPLAITHLGYFESERPYYIQRVERSI